MTPEYEALTRIHANVLGIGKDTVEQLEDDFELLRNITRTTEPRPKVMYQDDVGEESIAGVKGAAQAGVKKLGDFEKALKQYSNNTMQPDNSKANKAISKLRRLADKGIVDSGHTQEYKSRAFANVQLWGETIRTALSEPIKDDKRLKALEWVRREDLPNSHPDKVYPEEQPDSVREEIIAALEQKPVDVDIAKLICALNAMCDTPDADLTWVVEEIQKRGMLRGSE